MPFYFFDASGAVKLYHAELATALENKGLNSILVCADEKLCNAAISEGLQVLNPEK